VPTNLDEYPTGPGEVLEGISCHDEMNLRIRSVKQENRILLDACEAKAWGNAIRTDPITANPFGL
jgi:hypothetical protein